MKYLTYILIGIAFLHIKCTTCGDVKKHALSLSYKFKIIEKSKGQEISLKGYDSLNRIIEFSEGEFWGIYNSIEIGDTLYKELGKTELILIKKDTTLVFPLKCRGKIVE
jgi:hypothetical protein